ncbi:hypothetical protein [Profundibacter sp.]
MSEPVSSAEIEDVLSSIRRLVSNDVEAAKEKTPSTVVEVEPAGKLILTADFRVSAPEEPCDKTADDVEPTDVKIKEVDRQDEAHLKAVEETLLKFHHTEHTTEAPAEPDIAQEDSNEIWQDPAEQTDSDATDAALSLEDTIADLEAAIGQQKGEWEPDGSDFEEDADAEEVMSEPVQDWIDGTAQEIGVEAKAVPEDAATADLDDPDLFGIEESVIDEETLRDLVSDIVRQELQGALGERITRNVRKLVRREINRVLAAQDFD